MVDEAAVTIAPLGGRHVNHFWRLLSGLNIPYVTLLDLDVARFGGGWGRIKYVASELIKHCPTVAYLPDDQVTTLPKWDNSTYLLLDVEKNPQYKNYVQDLEPLGVFFSSPMDLDFSMLVAFPKAFGLSATDLVLPKVNQVKSVLGESCFKPTQYTPTQRKHFIAYHKLFKLDSKPKSHLEALSKLTDEELHKAMPASLSRLVDYVITRVEALHE